MAQIIYIPQPADDQNYAPQPPAPVVAPQPQPQGGPGLMGLLGAGLGGCGRAKYGGKVTKLFGRGAPAPAAVAPGAPEAAPIPEAPAAPAPQPAAPAEPLVDITKALDPQGRSSIPPRRVSRAGRRPRLAQVNRSASALAACRSSSARQHRRLPRFRPRDRQGRCLKDRRKV